MVDIGAVLDEIDDALGIEEVAPDEITTAQYAERFGITYQQAKGRLKRGVRDGKLSGRKIMIDGKWTWVYKLARRDAPDEH